MDKRLKQYLGDELTGKVQQNHYGLTINHFWEMVVFLFVPLSVNATLFFMLDILLGLQNHVLRTILRLNQNHRKPMEYVNGFIKLFCKGSIKVFRKKIYDSLDALQADLDNSLIHYNTE